MGAKIGEEVIIKGKIVDSDSNPHGQSIKVEVIGFMDRDDVANAEPFKKNIKFWIHRVDQQEVIVR